jgi:hypothetical protein
MTTVVDQVQMYYNAERKSAELNQAFLFLVENGMTRTELEKNIKRRPALWGRFSHWLDAEPLIFAEVLCYHKFVPKKA